MTDKTTAQDAAPEPGQDEAGATTTRLCVISSIRQLDAPRAITSPTRDS